MFEIFSGLFSFLLAAFFAIPFWFIWTYLGVGAMFNFLPEPLQGPGFWATVGIFMCLSILSAVVFLYA